MNTNDPAPPDDQDVITRLYSKVSALEIVTGVLIGRLSEADPEVREDVRRDVDAVLAGLPIDGTSEEAIAGEIRRAVEALLSVSLGG